MNGEIVVVVTASSALAVGLSALLQSLKQVDRVERVTDAAALVDHVRHHPPALILIDGGLKDVDVLDLLAAARHAAPDSRQIILSEDMDQLRKLKSSRVETVVVNGSHPKRLARTIEQLLDPPVVA